MDFYHWSLCRVRGMIKMFDMRSILWIMVGVSWELIQRLSQRKYLNLHLQFMQMRRISHGISVSKTEILLDPRFKLTLSFMRLYKLTSWIYIYCHGGELIMLDCEWFGNKCLHNDRGYFADEGDCVPSSIESNNREGNQI